MLTTRELGRLFRYNKINMASLPSEHYDSPMGTGSGALLVAADPGTYSAAGRGRGGGGATTET